MFAQGSCWLGAAAAGTDISDRGNAEQQEVMDELSDHVRGESGVQTYDRSSCFLQRAWPGRTPWNEISAYKAHLKASDVGLFAGESRQVW